MNSWKCPVLLIAVLLLHSSPCGALYAPPAFHQLATGSDLVVLGRIVSLSNDTFSLAIEEVLVGACPDTVLQVVRFKDWTCSRRWQPYAIGQREIAFLCRSGSRYRTNSPGAEGEWQVIDDHVTCSYLPMEFMQKKYPALPTLDRILPLNLVVSAIKDLEPGFASRRNGKAHTTRRRSWSCPTTMTLSFPGAPRSTGISLRR